MNRRTATSLYTVSLALIGMVADKGANDGKRIIVEEYLPGLIQPVIAKQVDHLRDWGVDRASFLTERALAIEAAFCFRQNVISHKYPSSFPVLSGQNVLFQNPFYSGSSSLYNIFNRLNKEIIHEQIYSCGRPGNDQLPCHSL